jgi:hypothetical protein
MVLLDMAAEFAATLRSVLHKAQGLTTKSEKLLFRYQELGRGSCQSTVLHYRRPVKSSQQDFGYFVQTLTDCLVQHPSRIAHRTRSSNRASRCWEWVSAYDSILREARAARSMRRIAIAPTRKSSIRSSVSRLEGFRVRTVRVYRRLLLGA